MKTATLRDLWVEELKDLLNAENQILKALPKMAKTATTPELREAFEEHLKQTEGHVDRLEQIFSSLGETARGTKCKGMEGIISEGKELMEQDMPEELCDAAMIGAAQRVEHYEIAAYGTVKSYAEQLGEDEAVNLLEQTLEEEKETDRRLTEIAEQNVNLEAEEGDDSGEEDEEGGTRRRSGNGKMASSGSRSRSSRR